MLFVIADANIIIVIVDVNIIVTFLLSPLPPAASSGSVHRKLLQGPSSCACGFDSFCCNSWDESCQLCEFGWATQFGCPAAGCPFGDNPFAAPRGSLFTPGEFEPNEGILLAYEGPNSWLNIVAQMAAAVSGTGDRDDNEVLLELELDGVEWPRPSVLPPS